MTDSRLIGALFLAGYLTYGVGSVLAKSVTDGSNFLSTISADHGILVLGAFLILSNTAVDIAKAVLFFPILEQHGKRTALTYLATMIIEVVFLSLGAFCLLMIVPLGHHAGEAWAQGLASLLVQSNTMAYQIGEAVLGFGALFLCALLWRSRLIPRWLAISGLIGYACLMAGQIAEIFGIPIGTYLTIPGFFFELALPFWLFTRGFQPEAYRGQPVTASAAWRLPAGRGSRTVDGPNYVMIDLEFDTKDQAEALLAAMRQVWSRVEGQVLWNPQARIVEVVERTEYWEAPSGAAAREHVDRVHLTQ